MNQSEHIIDTQRDASLVTTVHVMYALHMLSLGIGALGAASVVGQFLFGWPSIIALVLNYMKRDEARGTWLESHFRWQLRTFWYAFGWTVLIGLVSLVLLVVVIGIATWMAGMFVLGIWAIYRILYGWLRLKNGRPIEI